MDARSKEETRQLILADELPLTLQALRHNPKIYSVWEHRKWVLQNLPKPQWRHELGLVNKFLEADARNCESCFSIAKGFATNLTARHKVHGWAYRRYVIASDPNCSSLQAEFDFTTTKIMASFSNFSAWQYRADLLDKFLVDLPEAKLLLMLDKGVHFPCNTCYEI